MRFRRREQGGHDGINSKEEHESPSGSPFSIERLLHAGVALQPGLPVTGRSPRLPCLRPASEHRQPISICHSRQAPNATKVTRK